MWLEKSPHHTLMADQLARDFPDARFLCIVRDPRSNYLSMLRWDQRRGRNIEGLVGRYVPVRIHEALAHSLIGELLGEQQAEEPAVGVAAAPS